LWLLSAEFPIVGWLLTGEAEDPCDEDEDVTVGGLELGVLFVGGVLVVVVDEEDL
jgi:hypothetical protein